MKCPDCHMETDENPCPQCGKKFHDSQMNIHQNQKKNDEILEPEIVNDNEDWNRQNTYSYQEQYKAQSGNTFKNYTFVNPNFNMQNSCFPGFISIFLSVFVLVQLGFLAALGFVFFLLVGKAVSFYILLQNLSRGKVIPPIIFDAIVWVAAYSLVAWLAE